MPGMLLMMMNIKSIILFFLIVLLFIIIIISFELLKCGTNGLWQGEFPVCTPKKTCSKSEIFDTLNPTIQLEQIGNVYWFNESEWFAIEHTWIHYTCSNFDGIMVGKSERTCRGGHWTNKVPHCTTGK